MEFTLYYRGPLRASGSGSSRVKHKHALRKHFHKQLKQLWDQPPLGELGGSSFVIRERGGFRFVPLVATDLVAELRITMLRPGPPGSIVT